MLVWKFNVFINFEFLLISLFKMNFYIFGLNLSLDLSILNFVKGGITLFCMHLLCKSFWIFFRSSSLRCFFVTGLLYVFSYIDKKENFLYDFYIDSELHAETYKEK